MNYQSFHQGGCTNTTAKAAGRGWIQETNTARQSPQGTVLVAKR